MDAHPVGGAALKCACKEGTNVFEWDVFDDGDVLVVVGMFHLIPAMWMKPVIVALCPSVTCKWVERSLRSGAMTSF